jgi:ATP-binding cassette subfamily B multidrug efflux pump
MIDEDIVGKAYDARLMRRLLHYLRPYSPQAALALAAIIANSMLQLAQPYLMKLAIDTYIPAGRLDGVNRIALWYFLILVASFLLEFTQTWLLQNTGQRIMFDMRMEIYAHLQRLDLRFYDRNPVGRLMTRVTTDVDVINDMFTSGVVSIFGDVFTLAGIMIVMLTMNWCSCSAARRGPMPASKPSTRSTARPTSIRSSTTPCSTRRSRSSVPSPRR